MNGDVNPDCGGVLIDELTKEFASETDRLDNAARRKTRNEELHTTLASIREDLSEVTLALSDRIKEPGFKIGDFKYAVKKANEQMESLKKELEKLFPRNKN